MSCGYCPTVLLCPKLTPKMETAVELTELGCQVEAVLTAGQTAALPKETCADGAPPSSPGEPAEVYTEDGAGSSDRPPVIWEGAGVSDAPSPRGVQQ